MDENVATMLPQIGITTDTIPVKNALFYDKINAKKAKHEKEKKSFTTESYIEKRKAEIMAEAAEEANKRKILISDSMSDEEIHRAIDQAVKNAANEKDVSDECKDIIVELYSGSVLIYKLVKKRNKPMSDREINDIVNRINRLTKSLSIIKSTAPEKLKAGIKSTEKAAKKVASEIKDALAKESFNEEIYEDPFFEATELINEIKVGSMTFKSNISSDDYSKGDANFNSLCAAKVKELSTTLANGVKEVGKIIASKDTKKLAKNFTPIGSEYSLIQKGTSAIIVIDNKQYAYTTDPKNVAQFTEILHLLRQAYFEAKKAKIPGITLKINSSKIKVNDKPMLRCYIDIIAKAKVKVQEAKPVKESASIELKRLDEKRAKLEKLQDQLVNVTKKINSADGTTKNEKQANALKNHITKLEKEIASEELMLNKKKEKEINEAAFCESVDDVYTEAKKIDPAIKKIVEEFESKGYLVKYASPGHNKLRKKGDTDSDGVYHGKLYSDARVMFADDYDLPSAAPKYWHWRMVDGKDYLDISPVTYNKENGTPDEAFKVWKKDYLASLRDFAKGLEPAKHLVRDSEKTESFDIDSYIDEVFEAHANKYDLSTENEIMEGETVMNDLIYDLIIDSLSNYVESGELDYEEAEIIAESACDELFYEGNNLERDLKKYKMKKALKGVGKYAKQTVRSAATGAAAGAVGGAVGGFGVKNGAKFGAKLGTLGGLLGSAVNATSDGLDKIRDIKYGKEMLKNKTTEELQEMKNASLLLLKRLTKKYKNSDARSQDDELGKINELRQAMKYIDAELAKRK